MTTDYVMPIYYYFNSGFMHYTKADIIARKGIVLAELPIGNSLRLLTPLRIIPVGDSMTLVV